MDIARPDIKRKRQRRLAVIVVLTIIAVGVAGALVLRLKPAAPSVESSAIWRDTVKRGPLVRQVRGLGTLVPREDRLRLIPAETEATVLRIHVLPGTQVKPDTILVDLANPQVTQEAQDAELALKAAEAGYQNAKVQLQSTLMTQKAGAATIGSDYQQAQRQASTDKALYDLGECLLALSAHRHIDRALRQALAGKHRRMPASPDYGQVRPRSLRRTRHAQGI